MLNAVKENVIESLLVRRVSELGGIALKVNTPSRRGFFDRLLVLPGGRIVFCEVKRPRGGRMAAHQIVYAKMLAQLGAEVALIRNEEDIARLLS